MDMPPLPDTAALGWLPERRLSSPVSSRDSLLAGVLPPGRRLLRRDLQAAFRAGAGAPVALRTEAGSPIQAFHGVEADHGNNHREIGKAPDRGQADVGTQYSNIYWMLAGVRVALAEVHAAHYGWLASGGS